MTYTVVFTAILGGSDRLKPAPAGADRAVCFTDDETLVDAPNGWEVARWGRNVAPRLDARLIRCHSHLYLPKARTVWCDASLEVHDLAGLLRDAGDAEFAAWRHPERSSCYAEAEEVIAIGQQDATLGERQIARYRATGFAPTELTTALVLVRQPTARVARFNELWWDHIQEFGPNDQVSLDFCAWSVGLSVHYLQGTYIDNPYATYDMDDHHARRRPYTP